jgi:DNA polymerase-1
VRTRGGLLRDLGQEPYGWKLTEALNTPVQGSGAECLLESLIALPDALAGLDAFLVHHVHDEVILECAEADAEAAKHALTEAMVKGFMTLFPEADMPGLVEAHSGPDWSSAKG